MTNEQIQSMLFPQTHSQNHSMSSIKQIIAEHKRKHEEAEAKKVTMTRREWLEYLPREYKEPISGLMDEGRLDYTVDNWWAAVMVGVKGEYEDRPFFKDGFWFQLDRWAKGESQHLPYIPGVIKHPLYFPLPDVSKVFIPEFKGVIDEPSVPKPTQKEIRLTDVKADIAPILGNSQAMTRGQWFDTLPDEYKKYCTHHIGGLSRVCKDMEEAILFGAPSVYVGVEFWDAMADWVRGKRNTLPPIPGVTRQPMYCEIPRFEHDDDIKDQPTEAYSTRHTIPYNGGDLPLFASL